MSSSDGCTGRCGIIAGCCVDVIESVVGADANISCEGADIGAAVPADNDVETAATAGGGAGALMWMMLILLPGLPAVRPTYSVGPVF